MKGNQALDFRDNTAVASWVAARIFNVGEARHGIQSSVLVLKRRDHLALIVLAYYTIWRLLFKSFDLGLVAVSERRQLQ